MPAYRTLFLAALITTSCVKPADFAELTAPMVYAIANNALKNGKPNGHFTVDITFENLKRGQDEWPHGTIQAVVTSPDYDQKATVTYVLNGTHTATAIVSIPGKERQQYPINLVESAIVFGQAQTVEKHVEKMADELASRIDSKRKLAIFDAEGLDGQRPLFGKSLAESFVTAFSRRGVTVVERKLLDSALREMNFQRTGLTGDDVRKEMGRFLGADTMLVATVKGAKQEIVINARTVDIESGTIISSSQIIMPRYLVTAKDLAGVE